MRFDSQTGEFQLSSIIFVAFILYENQALFCYNH